MGARWTKRHRSLRGTLWQGTLAAFVALGLLLAFYQVVRGAVDQAATRRQAVALQTDTSWRCQQEPGLGASQHCTEKRASTPPLRATAPGRVVMLAAGR